VIRITHIINPVKVSPKSDLFVAQPVTFETMRRAKEFAKKDVDVNLLSTCYEEDTDIIPEYFAQTENLDRSILDFDDFTVKRKLPLLRDILDRAVAHDAAADYIIYTNVDIAVMPHFYLFVKQKIEEGHDAFVINRRTISNTYTLETLDSAYGDYGEDHPGFDCFVFKKSAYEEYQLGKICIGTTRIGLVFIANLMMNSDSFHVFKKEHLTFHIGEDRIWENKDLNDYVEFNEKEAIHVLEHFVENKAEKFQEHDMLERYYLSLISKGKSNNTVGDNHEKHTLFKRIINKLK